MQPKIFRAVGLMSGTSIDGIDAALVETDGHNHVRPLAFAFRAYDGNFRSEVRRLFGLREIANNPHVARVERELTELHAETISDLLRRSGNDTDTIDLIGFHGQTLWHRPEEGTTCQIGDGALLARMTGIPVVNDFRSADIRARGQGAPLVPLYHRALSANLPKPLAILNIGGVANITWIGGKNDDDMLAFDVGPGNAPLDDWVLRHTGKPFDAHGALAASGRIQKELVEKAMQHPFFQQRPPKSLDRDAFPALAPDGLSPADGAATITRIIACGIAESLKFMPEKPRHIHVAGGGRLNDTLMRHIADLAGVPLSPVDELGWSGDGLEAEAFAYLAVRSRLGLPLSIPGTTGVRQPTTGGVCYEPNFQA